MLWPCLAPPNNASRGDAIEIGVWVVHMSLSIFIRPVIVSDEEWEKRCLNRAPNAKDTNERNIVNNILSAGEASMEDKLHFPLRSDMLIVILANFAPDSHLSACWFSPPPECGRFAHKLRLRRRFSRF